MNVDESHSPYPYQAGILIYYRLHILYTMSMLSIYMNHDMLHQCSMKMKEMIRVLINKIKAHLDFLYSLEWCILNLRKKKHHFSHFFED
jgi:hypothetical protein